MARDPAAHQADPGRSGAARRVRRLGEVAVERWRALATRQAVVGSLVEGIWAGTHLALYPLGARTPDQTRATPGYRVAPLSPVQRGLVVSGVAASGTPILLLHGMADNHSIFAVLRRGLSRRGFTQVFAMNYSVLTSDVRTAAAQLADEVEAICEETGYERLHVVAHSLGGVVARYYVTRLGGDERVHTLVTLGAPHHGTLMAHLLPTRLARQLRPGSALLRELDRPAPGCRTRVVAFWSDTDQMIVPADHAALRHPDLDVTTIELKGVGHLSLLILPSVVHQIATDLAQLDGDGARQASVTDLTVPATS